MLFVCCFSLVLRNVTGNCQQNRKHVDKIMQELEFKANLGILKRDERQTREQCPAGLCISVSKFLEEFLLL